jgi:peptidyl-prolyl cis-trans isomerase SurA
MSETENKQSEHTTSEEVLGTDTDAPDTHTHREEVSVESGEGNKKSSNLTFIIGAVLIVGVVILAILFQLEKEGRSSTNIFGNFIASQEANRVVAEVNGKELVNSDLAVSIEQFTQMAQAQGVDITSETVQADIRSQSLDVMINTELLKQEAAERNIEVTEEAVAERLDAIVNQLGGEAQLEERMASLGIDEEKLQADIREEILIQNLLDEVFAESNLEVTEEEISAVYQTATDGAEDVPALDQVRDQVEAQIRTSKEQEAVDSLISELREEADIQIIE